MKRTRTSNAWLREHVNDPYVQRAKAEGYRSRASFKLMEIDERELREQYLASICEQLDAAPVQHIGKLLVVWRPNPDAKPATTPRRGRVEPRRSKRSFQGGTRS